MMPRAQASRYEERTSALCTLKLEMGCSDCGYNANPDALDFDHVRGTKTKNVSRMTQDTLEHLVEELDKCEVVCANCHRIRTFSSRRATRERVLLPPEVRKEKKP